MLVIGTIRSTATERIFVEADDYEPGLEELRRRIPEGHELIVIRTEQSPTSAD